MEGYHQPGDFKTLEKHNWHTEKERERDWGTIATESCDLDRDFVSASIQSLIIFYAYVYSFLAA